MNFIIAPAQARFSLFFGKWSVWWSRLNLNCVIAAFFFFIFVWLLFCVYVLASGHIDCVSSIAEMKIFFKDILYGFFVLRCYFLKSRRKNFATLCKKFWRCVDRRVSFSRENGQLNKYLQVIHTFKVTMDSRWRWRPRDFNHRKKNERWRKKDQV